jgi:hypothetical protein
MKLRNLGIISNLNLDLSIIITLKLDKVIRYESNLLLFSFIPLIVFTKELITSNNKGANRIIPQIKIINKVKVNKTLLKYDFKILLKFITAPRANFPLNNKRL